MPVGVILLHQHQTKSKMKTTTITLAAIFTLFTNVLLAGNDFVSPPAAPSTYTYSILAFAPVAPAEATYEDTTPAADLNGLVPVVPSEASFEDTATKEISVAGLSPVIPAVADFE
jgi:hypothetical protein